jgi:hypothetical protein
MNDAKNNHPVALCFARINDLRALMVGSGWAWADTQFSDQYIDAEQRAARRGVGVHEPQLVRLFGNHRPECGLKRAGMLHGRRLPRSDRLRRPGSAPKAVA